MTPCAAHSEDAVTIAEITPPATPDPSSPPRSAAEWCAAADVLLRAADLRAYDVLRAALREFPDDLRLQQLIARALVQCGAVREANDGLTRLRAAGHADAETVGLLARTHKDLWEITPEPAEREAHLDAAIGAYTEAWHSTGSYWTGINAATLLALSDRHDEATALARDVASRCETLLAQAPAGERYWILATLGEAALVRRDLTAAAAYYTQAAATAPPVAQLVSTRRNARLLLRHFSLDAAPLDAWLPVPKVIVFAGHLIDRPTRAHPRFPAALEPIVQDAIRQRLARIGPAIGYAAAACGADLLFLEAMRANGCDTHIVLPYGTDQFQPDSVDYLPGTTWSARFDAALQAATHVVTAAEHRLGDGGMSYEYGFRVLDGEAAMHADKLDTELVCLAVWDGLPGDGPGGTASSIEHWRRAQRRIEIIDLTALRTQHAAGRRAEAQPAAASHTLAASSETQSSQAGTADEPPDTMNAEIVGLLFADAHGFSKLTEAELPVFVEHYLGLVAAVLARMPAPPLLTNTWGDGLYVVYRDVQDTGEFALRLNEAVLRTDWPSLGIRHGLSLRIGLHAGPAYACTDPVTRRPNYIGAHVSRAARIEPIAPAGEVYASGAFAALARSEQARGFRCTYVGETPLAKGYGTFPTYVVRRSGLRQP